MSSGADKSDPKSNHAARFENTRWSIVLAAGRKSSPQARAALATLCEAYWFPLYAFVRSQGYAVYDAQDLTQEFLARLLDKNYVASADRSKGRFRTYLVACVKHFLANQRDRARAKKRGGSRAILPLDFGAAESRLCHEPAHTQTAERVFAKRWAVNLLERVLGQLRADFEAADKTLLFERLKDYLTASTKSASYAQVAVELDMTQGAVKVAVHRLRGRYRQLLRDEVAQTVADPAQIEDEIRDLFAALAT